MTTTKPKYEDLTTEQVCDLIATKVMGWHASGSVWRDENDSLVRRSTRLNPGSYDTFKPMGDFNDAWLAEEKLREMEENRYYITYIIRLSEMCGGVSNAIHATASQRCKALLLAIGEVEA